MGSVQQQPSLPGRQAVRGWLTRSRRLVANAPLPVQVLAVALACVCAPPLIAIGLLAALVFAPYALWTGDRSRFASLSVAVWGIAFTAALAHGPDGPRYLLLLLAPVVSVVARIGAAGRVQVPCRTAALVLVWSLPIGIAMFRLWHTQRLFGPAAAWLIALVVFGWRLAKALQDSREQARTSSVAGALAAPYAMATAGSGGPAAAPPGAAAAAAAAAATCEPALRASSRPGLGASSRPGLGTSGRRPGQRPRRASGAGPGSGPRRPDHPWPAEPGQQRRPARPRRRGGLRLAADHH